MKWINKKRIRDEFETDENITRLRRWLRPLPSQLPGAAAQYAIAKVPIVHWLPRYLWGWLLSDLIAGLTIAAILIPQALAYAHIANIPGVYGLYSSWLPALIYVVMGTSKDLSPGPSAIQGLLTAQVIAQLSGEGYSPPAIASAVATMVGVYASLMGFLKLGFILNYISAPVLSGFISAAAITIVLSQVDSLVGLEQDGSDGNAAITRNFLTHFQNMNPLTIAIGLGGIVLLVAIEQLGKRWGGKYRVVKMVSNSRAVFSLILFTSISYGANRGREKFLWAITEVKTDGIIPPRAPDMNLVVQVAAKSIAPLIGMAVEHLGCGKSFGQRNKYVIDESQELCFLGVSNIFNSFFGAMSTGAAMSRSAVNSDCNVKSPLGGIFTSAFVLLTIYQLAGVLFWIPKATLSAIIITAIVNMIDISIFYRFWRTSLADFIASMLAFWITLFVDTETGIVVSVVFSVGYTMLRLAFTKPIIVKAEGAEEEEEGTVVSWGDERLVLPNDTFVASLTDAVFFPNAPLVKTHILESIQVRYLTEKPPSDKKADDRSWSVAAERKLKRLRRIGHITPSPSPLKIVVLDFNRVTFMDYTGTTALWYLRSEVESYLGHPVQFRLVRPVSNVRRRLERAGWPLVEGGRLGLQNLSEVVEVYETLNGAVWSSRFDPEGGYIDENSLKKSETSDNSTAESI